MAWLETEGEISLCPLTNDIFFLFLFYIALFLPSENVFSRKGCSHTSSTDHHRACLRIECLTMSFSNSMNFHEFRVHKQKILRLEALKIRSAIVFTLVCFAESQRHEHKTIDYIGTNYDF